MAGDTINYGQLKDQVQGRRFTTVHRTSSIPWWLHQAYQDVWDAGDWWFKKVLLADVALAPGVVTATIDDSRGHIVDVLAVADENGDEVPQLPWIDFRRRFGKSLADSTVRSKPTHWASNGGTIYFGPRTDVAYEWSCDYRRGIATLTAAGAEQAGWFQADEDTPIWHGHHRILVCRAQSIGLKEINDPTFGPLDDEYDVALARFTEDFHDRGAAPVQYGRQLR